MKLRMGKNSRGDKTVIKQIKLDILRTKIAEAGKDRDKCKRFGLNEAVEALNSHIKALRAQKDRIIEGE